MLSTTLSCFRNGSTWASGMASIGASWRGPGLDGQHAHVDALHTRGRDMGNELQVVRLGLDRDQAVASTHLAAALVLVQHQGGRLDLAAGDMGDGAGGDLGQLIAEHAAAVVGAL